jgi:predicted PurR-regulated permease PerM
MSGPPEPDALSSAPAPVPATTDDAQAPTPAAELAREERRALNWFALGAAALIAWMVSPVAMGIFLGALIAFSLQPLYEYWKPRLGSSLASLATVLVATVGLLVTFGGLGWLLVARGSSLARAFIAAVAPQGNASAVVARVSGLTSRVGVGPEELQQKLTNWAETAAAQVATIAEAVLAASATSLLALFFAALTTNFILRNWQRMSRRAEEVLPLNPAYTVALFDEFRRVGRTTFLGTIVTGLAQGVFATIGYWLTGVINPVFFGVLTALASLIPAVGTLLVWVPIGVVLILTGHVGGGVVELVWGMALIVGASDYVIRPRLVGGEGELPSLVTFGALFGGVEVFGLKGLVVGPVFMSLSIAVLRIYGREMRERRSPKGTT